MASGIIFATITVCSLFVSAEASMPAALTPVDDIH